MNDYIDLGDARITASISYYNLNGGYYIIGLHIGGIYTILDKNFKTKEEAKHYLFNEFYGE